MIDLVKTLGIAGAAAVAMIFLIRDVLGPLVKDVVGKKKAAEQMRPGADRVTALEINLTNLSTQVTQLESRLGVKNTELVNLVDERSIATDNKLDIVLAELKSLREDHAEAHRQLGERIARAETNIEHILRTARHR